MDKTTMIFLVIAAVLIIAAFAVFLLGSRVDTSKKKKKVFDPDYVIKFTEHNMKTSSIEATLQLLIDEYDGENDYMRDLAEKAYEYIQGDYGDYETALAFLNPDDDPAITKAHANAIQVEVAWKYGLPQE